jgi:hypothetical protein
MSFTYSELVTDLANVLQVEADNADYLAILPRVIEYATDRIENDLDLLSQHATATVTLVSGTRTATIPTPSGAGNGPIYIVESANVITPASTAPNSGTRNPLYRVSLEKLNFEWPTVTSTGLPKEFALQDDTTLVLGPAPDATYQVEVVGVYRPAMLSNTTTTTWLTNNLPELFFAACCVWGFSWQRDLGPAMSGGAPSADNPMTTMSWEATYQSLLKSDMVVEFRKRSWSSAWTPMMPAPTANPPRQ